MKSRNNSTIYCRVNDSNELEFSITSSKWIAPQKYQEIKKEQNDERKKRKMTITFAIPFRFGRFSVEIFLAIT